MVVIRNVFQAKIGRAGELAQAMTESLRQAGGTDGGPAAWRVLTELSRPFDTIVMEVEAESLAAWEQARGAMFTTPAFQDNFVRTSDLVVLEHNELSTVEACG